MVKCGASRVSLRALSALVLNPRSSAARPPGGGEADPAPDVGPELGERHLGRVEPQVADVPEEAQLQALRHRDADLRLNERVGLASLAGAHVTAVRAAGQLRRATQARKAGRAPLRLLGGELAAILGDHLVLAV